MKIVVNRCYGGFGLSDKAIEMIMNRKGLGCFRYQQTKYSFRNGVDEYVRRDKSELNNGHIYYYSEDLGKKINNLSNKAWWYDKNIERTDNDLIAVVEELGEEADGKYAELEVVEIPDDVDYKIDDYDGIETIHEVHRSW